MDNTQLRYKLSETTPEEQKAFMDEFQSLLDKHSLYFEPVPQYVRDSLQSPWQLKCQIFLQKKTLEEPGTPVEGAVASTDPEVNPNAPSED